MPDRVPLSSIAEINPCTDVSSITPETPVSFIPMSDVIEGGGCFSRDMRPLLDARKGYTLFQRNDVIIAKITPCFENGKVASLNKLGSDFGLGSTEFHVLRAKPGNDSRFIYHRVRHSDFLRAGEASMTGSAGQRRVPACFFNRFEILEISGDSQVFISDILDAIDDAIIETDALIAKLKYIHIGLLTDFMGRSSKNYSKRLVPLSAFAQINPSTDIESNDPNMLVEFLPMSAVHEGGGWLASQQKPISDYRKGYTLFQRNDVLLAKITPCFENGKIAILDDLPSKFGLGSTEFHVLRAKDGCNARFVYNAMRLPDFLREGVASMTGSAGQRRVPAKFFDRFLVPQLTTEEQAEIAEVMDASDRNIQILTIERDKLAALRNGLRDDLLTGRVSVGRLTETATSPLQSGEIGDQS